MEACILQRNSMLVRIPKTCIKTLTKQALISNNQNEKELTLDSLISLSSIFLVCNELQILCIASLAISFVTLLHNVHSTI